ncbi:hypothetical protein [Cerasicoccus frondis]|uniref:hypothetical protein n=1 Tax=Cerasicoccus frondis TaxID=490090 RepID=UPI002852AB82|nr:hypothetical protein [Cerasicoccus frondis]
MGQERAVWKAWRRKQDRQLMRDGALKAVIVNAMARPKPPAKADDFMPRKTQTPDDMLALMMALYPPEKS